MKQIHGDDLPSKFASGGDVNPFVERLLVSKGPDEEERARVDAGGKATQNREIREAVAGGGLRIPTRELLEKVCYAHTV